MTNEDYLLLIRNACEDSANKIIELNKSLSFLALSDVKGRDNLLDKIAQEKKRLGIIASFGKEFKDRLNKIDELNNSISNAKSVDEIAKLSKELEFENTAVENMIKHSNDSTYDNKEEENVNNSRRKVNKVRKSKKFIVLSKKNLALLLALLSLNTGILLFKDFEVFFDRKDNDKDKEKAPYSSVETGDTVAFTDVNDEAQVILAADAFLNNISIMNPNHDFTREEIVNMIKLINGGNIEMPGYETMDKDDIDTKKSLLVASSFERLFYLIGQEALYSSNMINGYDIEDDKMSGLINYTELTVDNTKGEELLEKLENARRGIITHPTKEGAKTYATELMRIIVESWVLNGYKNEIAYMNVETPGMQALINMVMDSGANLIDSVDPDLAYERTYVNNGTTETQQFKLQDVIKEFSYSSNNPDFKCGNGQFANDYSAHLSEVYNTLRLKK
ncbi:MAG: hypothetical protein RR255_02285 [Bacilli bacterium]